MHTRSLPTAQRSADALSGNLERFSNSIRLEVSQSRELGLSLVHKVEAERGSAPVSIEDAFDSYFLVKGVGRSKTFLRATGRAVGYLTEATDVE